MPRQKKMVSHIWAQGLPWIPYLRYSERKYHRWSVHNLTQNLWYPFVWRCILHTVYIKKYKFYTGTSFILMSLSISSISDFRIKIHEYLNCFRFSYYLLIHNVQLKQNERHQILSSNPSVQDMSQPKFRPTIPKNKRRNWQLQHNSCSLSVGVFSQPWQP